MLTSSTVYDKNSFSIIYYLQFLIAEFSLAKNAGVILTLAPIILALISPILSFDRITLIGTLVERTANSSSRGERRKAEKGEK